MAIKVTGIDHVHFNTRDIRAFTALMRRLFDVSETPIGHLMPLELYNVTMTMNAAGNDQAFLDIFEPSGVKGTVGQEMLEAGEGVSYVSFRVVDIDAAAEHAKACGLKEISRDGFGEGMKQVQFDTLDVLGFRLEFVEYGPNWEAELEGVKEKLRAGETVGGLKYVD